MTEPAPRRRMAGWGITLAGVVLAGLVVLALVRGAGDAPAQRLRGELPGVGPILVSVHLSPDPPRVGGTDVHVQVNEIAGAPVRGVSVSVRLGSAAGPRQDVALAPAGGGAHQGTIMFPDAGSWWLDIAVSAGGGALRLRLPVEVRADN